MKAFLFCAALCAMTTACAPPPAADDAAPVAERAQADPPARSPSPVQAEAPPPREDPHLQNLLQVAPGIYSGGEPQGQAAFARLAALGVKTVVSVDGATPDLALAQAHGLRYVHIPIGYDGIPHDAGLALARLVREAQGPFYIHCHHGRHRGPAAAAVACIAAGQTDGAGGRRILEQAGTSEMYAGLWRDVATYTPPSPGAALPELVEVARVDSMASAMARLDRVYDNLELCRDAGWQTPQDHPDLVPAQEALLITEALREAARHLGDDYDRRFKTWLVEAESRARAVQNALVAEDLTGAEESLHWLRQSCTQCHRAYRN